MSAPQDCCSPCANPIVTQVPGPPGNDGLPGTPGAAGINAFTLTTTDIVVPPISSDVTVNVLNSQWMAIGQVVVLDGPAHFRVASKPTASSAVITFQGFTGDVAPATGIAAGATVSPAGPQGP